MPRRRADVPPYRRMMPYLMRGKNEAAVYFEQHLDVARARPWLDAQGATVFHLILRALADVLHERPHLNRYVAGRRIYERDEVCLAFAAKKAMSDDAPLATVKRVFPAGESFAAMLADLRGQIREARSDRPSRVDQEVSILLRLPGPLLGALIAVLHRLDAWGLAPRSLTDPDPMYASAFVANLGSIGIDAAYHHLYEHGNCPLFVTIGRVVGTTVTLRYTYDERIEDGLYCARALELLRARVEDPERYYGQAVPPVSGSLSA